MRAAAAMLILFVSRALSACSCAGEANQLLLGHAQFVAEVTAVRPGEFEVVRVVRGTAMNKIFRGYLAPQPISCCDRDPHPIVAGEKYWLIAPEPEAPIGEVRLLQHNDPRADYLAHLHDLTPEQLRALLVRWRDGSILPHAFIKYINAVDVPGVSTCVRGYYHQLLMQTSLMARGNEDHSQCAPEDTARVRAASATSALASLGFIENESRAGRLVCARSADRARFLPDLVERQIKQTRVLYPCIDAGTHASGSPSEVEITTAALRSYFDQMQGANSNHSILLNYATLRPTAEQLKVRVFSPANAAAARDYASTEVAELVTLLRRVNSKSVAVKMPSSQFMPTSFRLSGCDGEFPHSALSDDLAVSRPAISGDSAILYLEYRGGARAYHLRHANDRWSVDWYVDLWQCG